jgi:cell division protein ZapA
MKNQVTVTIYGKSYPMLTDESREYTDRLANTLNNRMAELKEQKRSLSVQDAAAIISLECLDELIKNKQTEQNIRTQIGAYVEDANESRTALEKAQKENAQLKERIRQLESEIKLRMQFAGEESTAEQIVGRNVTGVLGAPPKK